MTRRELPFHLLVLCLFASCKITYTVRESGQYLKYQYNLPCGTMAVELKGRGNRDFMLVQKFSLPGKMQLNPVGLQILLNHQPVNYYLSDMQSGKMPKGDDLLFVREGQELEAGFTLRNGVYNGDTIVVHFTGYLRCDSKPVHMDDLFFYFAHGGINFQ